MAIQQQQILLNKCYVRFEDLWAIACDHLLMLLVLVLLLLLLLSDLLYDFFVSVLLC